MKIILTAVGAAVLWATSALGAELVMVESDTCFYCDKWHAEIGPIYPKTTESQFAPLSVHDIRVPMPKDMVLKSPVIFTPTFILVDDGREMARIEGYPGEDFFWGLLGMMLKEHTDYED